MWSSEEEEEKSQEEMKMQQDEDPGRKVGEGEDNLQEEMQAMKQVFLRMSEKVCSNNHYIEYHEKMECKSLGTVLSLFLYTVH